MDNALVASDVDFALTYVANAMPQICDATMALGIPLADVLCHAVRTALDLRGRGQPLSGHLATLAANAEAPGPVSTGTAENRTAQRHPYMSTLPGEGNTINARNRQRYHSIRYFADMKGKSIRDLHRAYCSARRAAGFPACHYSVFSRVCHGVTKSAAIMRWLSQTLSVPHSEMWS